jgi:hypothetical protein
VTWSPYLIFFPTAYNSRLNLVLFTSKLVLRDLKHDVKWILTVVFVALTCGKGWIWYACDCSCCARTEIYVQWCIFHVIFFCINWLCLCASRIVTIIKPLLYDSETLETGLFSKSSIGVLTRDVCVCMCVCVCVCVCVYMCVYVCVYMCMYVCVCMFVCMCVCVCGKDNHLLMSYAKYLRGSLVPELSPQISVISIFSLYILNIFHRRRVSMFSGIRWCIFVMDIELYLRYKLAFIHIVHIFMLPIPCIFLHSTYRPNNALNKFYWVSCLINVVNCVHNFDSWKNYCEQLECIDSLEVVYF